MKTKDLVLVSLFTALVVVLGLIPPIPMPLVPVPVTLQTFGVMLAGLILGPARGGLVVLLYVAMALIGVPVLPGGRAGLVVLAGPTAGFLLAMIPGAMLTGWLAGKPVASSTAQSATQVFWQILRCWLAAVGGGLILVYALGIPWLAFVAKMDLLKACTVMLVFVPIDLFKALLAAVVAQRVRRLNLT
jgi:biotin transport system substrate-specific component